MEVPYGIDSDDLAVFAGSPHTHIQQDDEAWKNLVKYHLTCRGLVERPIGEWYCDDECRKNGGGRVTSGRKQRRK